MQKTSHTLPKRVIQLHFYNFSIETECSVFATFHQIGTKLFLSVNILIIFSLLKLETATIAEVNKARYVIQVLDESPSKYFSLQ